MTDIVVSTGSALDSKVTLAYRFLVDNYQPGDEIFLFGFSRGAYTARCIGGLIGWAGILTKQEAIHFSEIWDLYCKRDPTKTETDEAAAAKFHDVTKRWPNSEASKVSSVKANMGLAPKPEQSDVVTVEAVSEDPTVKPPPIKVIGVWDTVGALGVPGQFSDSTFTQKYAFYDPGLGSSVEYAFHALALQEDRADFSPTYWYQGPDAPKSQVLRQCWFGGSHSDCGGGWSYHGLSDVTLAWMVAQLRDAPGGPLLNIDLDQLKGDTQDKSAGWGKQPGHKSRLSIEFQQTREVGRVFPKNQLDKVTWKSMVIDGHRHESIHHSVVVGGFYDPEKSPQFATLRSTPEGAKKLERLWKEASDPDSLLPTEKALKWEKGTIEETYEKLIADMGHENEGENGNKPSAHASEASNSAHDGEKNHDHHAGQLGALGGLATISSLPGRFISSVVNLRVAPADNLQPSAIGKKVETIRSRFLSKAKPDGKMTAEQLAALELQALIDADH